MYAPDAADADAARVDAAREQLVSTYETRADAERKADAKRMTTPNKAGFYSILPFISLCAVMREALTQNGLVMLSAFDGIGIATLVVAMVMRLPVRKLIIIEKNKSASEWSQGNLARLKRKTNLDVLYLSDIRDGDHNYGEIVRFLGKDALHLYFDASPCNGSSGNNYVTRVLNMMAHHLGKTFADSIALLKRLQYRQHQPIIVLKEYLAANSRTPSMTTTQLCTVFELPALTFDAILWNVAPRERSFYSNLPFAQVKPTVEELAQVRRRTLRDVLEGDARDCEQPDLIMTVGTSAGSSDSYVRTGDDDGERALHARERLAANGIAPAWSANNTYTTAVKPQMDGSGQVWAPDQVAFVLMPLLQAWLFVGGQLMSPEDARECAGW